MNLKTLQKGLRGIYVFICVLCILISYSNYSSYAQQCPVPTRLQLAAQELDDFVARSSKDHHPSNIDNRYAEYTLQLTLATDGYTRQMKWKKSARTLESDLYPLLKKLSKCNIVHRDFDVAYLAGLEEYAQKTLEALHAQLDVPVVDSELRNRIDRSRIHDLIIPTEHFVIYPLSVEEIEWTLSPYSIAISPDTTLIVVPALKIPAGVITLDSLRDEPTESEVARLVADALTSRLGLGTVNPSDEDMNRFCTHLQYDLALKASTKLQRLAASESVGLFPGSLGENMSIMDSIGRVEKALYPEDETGLLDTRISLLNELDQILGSVLNGGRLDSQHGYQKVLTSEFQLGIHGPLLIPILLGLMRVILPKLKGCANTRPRKRDRVKTHLSKKKSQ